MTHKNLNIILTFTNFRSFAIVIWKKIIIKILLRTSLHVHCMSREERRIPEQNPEQTEGF